MINVIISTTNETEKRLSLKGIKDLISLLEDDKSYYSIKLDIGHAQAIVHIFDEKDKYYLAFSSDKYYEYDKQDTNSKVLDLHLRGELTQISSNNVISKRKLLEILNQAIDSDEIPNCSWNVMEN